MRVSAPVVSLRSVCVDFDGRCVVEKVDLEIEAGEFVAVLGANGSGKSTLVRAMLGLQQIDHGQVQLFAHPVAEFNDWGRVALVPQSLPVASSVPISVWEMVLAGLATPKRRLKRLTSAQREAIESALATVGLSAKRKDRVDTLSGGQQRRVLIARALAQQPDLLVLDEPGAGLDAENLEILEQTLAELHQRGITIVAITHDLHELGPLVGRAVVLGDGRDTSVRYDGPPPVPGHVDEHAHHHFDEGGGAAPLLGAES